MSQSLLITAWGIAWGVLAGGILAALVTTWLAWRAYQRWAKAYAALREEEGLRECRRNLL